MSQFGGRLGAVIVRGLGAMHARGFHPAVLAGLVMMPAVVAVGVWTDHHDRAAPTPPAQVDGLRGSLDALP